ncbi:uncharacterized protein TNCV_4256651 [Trichonephila clavipes]|nr:uncharacterized protein TNCV_4256651 [Trichonephila clavipes]
MVSFVPLFTESLAWRLTGDLDWELTELTKKKNLPQNTVSSTCDWTASTAKSEYKCNADLVVIQLEEIPAQLACAYLKGHLKGRALDWFEVLGYRVIEDKTTDYAHLKQALSEQFPVVRNRSELETRFYSSSQRRDQQPSDFIYELLKIHKILKLEMSEEKLIDHVISRLEPQILDYVEHYGDTEQRNLYFGGGIPQLFFIPTSSKTKDRVVTAQEPRAVIFRVELQIRIREFQKPWEFHILDNMQYQCILGIDFMKASRLTLDFDQKSLIIPDHLIKQTPKEPKLVDIDLTESKLDDEQQRQLKALFNNFKGLFSDQPGLTHVVYHEIDTGDKGPVVSKPYKYDRVKQGIIDYHIDKMLRDGTICPINCPMHLSCINSKEQ